MAKVQGKPVRLLASRLDGEDCNIYCLQDGFVNVLLDLAERLEWGATWVDDLGDRAVLSDSQQQTIEEGIGALSMPCTITINNNPTIEIPPIQVDVNVTGGGSGDCLPFALPEPVRPDGTVIETVCLPVDPANPSGEYPVENADEETLTPPTGWPDWQSFIDSKCRAANYIVDALLGAAHAVDEAENRASVIMQIVQVVIEFMPVPAQKSVSWQKVLKWVEDALDFIDDVEEIWDWIQEIVQVVEDKRNEIVCILYTAPDVLFAATAIANATIPAFTAAMTAAGVQGNEQTAFIAFWNALVNDIVPRAFDYEWVLSIPDGYNAPYNCSACGGGDLGGGWLLVPMVYDNSFVPGGSGGVTGHAATPLGSYVRFSAAADSPGDLATFNSDWTCDEAEGLFVYGWHLDIDNLVNTDDAGVVNSGTPPPGGIRLNLQDITYNPPVPMWCVRDVFINQFELETGIDTNVAGASPPERFVAQAGTIYQMNMKQFSVISGSFSTDRKLFLICRTDQLGT